MRTSKLYWLLTALQWIGLTVAVLLGGLSSMTTSLLVLNLMNEEEDDDQQPFARQRSKP